MISRFLRAATVALLFSVAAAGCSPQAPVVARVGSRTVTLAELERVGRGNEGQYPGTPDQAKRELLDDVVRRAMMLELAHRRGDDTAAYVRNVRRDAEDREVLRALYATLAPAEAPVSEAEALRFWDWRNERIEAWGIFAFDRPRLESARRAILAGLPFEQAEQRYGVPGIVPPGGALGDLVPGSLFPPLDEALRALPAGAIGGPYETPQGWFLLKAGAHHANAQLPFALESSGLNSQLRRRKQQAAFARALASLRREYDVRLVPGGGQLIYQAMSPLGGSLQADPAQANAPIATWRGGQYTFGDVLLDLQRPDRQRPPSNLLPAIEQWIETQALYRVAMIEARRRHLHEEPDIRRRVDEQVESYMLDGLYQMAVINVPPPGEADIHTAWEHLKSRYMHLDNARAQWVDVADSTVATAILDHGRRGMPLAQAYQRVDPTLVLHDSTITYPSTDPQWSSLEATFLQLQPGQWAGVARMAAGWRLLQLVDKSQRDEDYESLPPALKQNLVGSAQELVREARFRVFTDSLTTVLRPEVHPEMLARLPWPIPAQAGGAR